jgi:hypothetical protein
MTTLPQLTLISPLGVNPTAAVSWNRLGADSFPHVSSTMKLSFAVRYLPSTPSMAQDWPLIQVKLCDRGDGPTTVTKPESTRKLSALLQADMVTLLNDAFASKTTSALEHQQSL